MQFHQKRRTPARCSRSPIPPKCCAWRRRATGTSSPARRRAADVKRSSLVIAALSDGFFESSWCAAEIAAAKEAGIKAIPCYSGDDHGAKQIDRWVKEFKDLTSDRAKKFPEFSYVFNENGRDVLNKQNPESTKRTLAYLASLLD